MAGVHHLNQSEKGKIPSSPLARFIHEEVIGNTKSRIKAKEN